MSDKSKLTHPKWNLCICQGTGYYMHAALPEISYKAIDVGGTELLYPNVEAHRITCEYHSGHGHNQHTAYKSIAQVVAEELAEVQAIAEPQKPLNPAPAEYPDGLDPEDMRQWCADRNVPLPPGFSQETMFWLNKPEYQIGYPEGQGVTWADKSYSTWGSEAKVPSTNEVLKWMKEAFHFNDKSSKKK